MNPFHWLSPAGPNGRLSIFIFHRVLAQTDPLLPSEPDAERFERIIAFIARYFRVLPLSEAASRLATSTLPAAAACITFDDGYADNLTVAAPILQRHGLTATFFVASSFIGGGRMWNDTVIEAIRLAPAGEFDAHYLGLGTYVLGDSASRVRAYGDMLRRLMHLDLPVRAERTGELARRAGLSRHSELMMTPHQLVALRDMRMEIGAHTMTHPILSRLGAAAALSEVRGGRDQLTDWLGETPRVFAYPNGVPGQDYGERDVQIVREAGFQAAVSTSAGSNAIGADLLQLARFTPWDREMSRFAVRCGMNLFSRPWDHEKRQVAGIAS